jgi:hypothetical protein
LADGQSVYWANGHTWIILTLNTKVGKFYPWNKHKHADTGSFRPDFVFVIERTCDFASSTTAAFLIITGYP